MSDKQFEVELKLLDGFTAIFEKFNGMMDQLESKVKSLHSKVSKFGNVDRNIKAKVNLNTANAESKISMLSKKLKQKMKNINFGALGAKGLAVTGALGYAFKQPVNIASAYEDAFKDIRKSVTGTADEFAVLDKQMRAFKGASYEEIGKVVAEAGKMGFSAKNVMAFSENVMKGAKALDFNAEMAVTQIGKILSMTNQMGTAVESSKDIMDKVAKLENTLAGVKGAGIIDVWKRSADMFNQLNFDNKTMGGMAGFLEQVSTSSELGASSFKIMINRFKRLEGEFGFFEKIKTGGIQGLKDVMSEISKMTPEQQIKKFGAQAMTLITKLQSKENLLKLDFAIQMSGESKGALEREWDIYMGTFTARQGIFLKSWRNFLAGIGKPMTQVVDKLYQILTPIFNTMSKWIGENKELAGSIAKFAGVFIGVLGAVSLLSLAVSGLITAFAFLTSPITLVVGAIALLGVGILAIIKYSDKLWNGIKSVWTWFSNLAVIGKVLVGVLALLFAPITLALGAFAGVVAIINHWDSLVQTLKDVWEWVTNVYRAVRDFDWGGLVFDNFLVSGYITYLKTLWEWVTKIVGGFEDLFSKFDKISDIGKIKDNIKEGILDFAKEKIPFIGEFLGGSKEKNDSNITLKVETPPGTTSEITSSNISRNLSFKNANWAD